MQQELKEEIYPLFSGIQGLEELGRALARHIYPDVFILVDDNTATHCLPLLEAHTGPLKIIKVKSGEQHKSLDTCNEIWETLVRNQAGRQTLLLNLGGGVITDMGGFCAAVYKRGIEYINIPTTLLAMVDASIGSKTGVNFRGIKNTIGSFCAPRAVYIYTGFLHTLPRREYLAAFAEIAKHGLVADSRYWDNVKFRLPGEITDIEEIIAHSLKVKQHFVAADPGDNGVRKSLNFGHSIGHALESASLREGRVPLLHGEAVAAGLLMESYISHRKCGLELKVLNELIVFYGNFFKGIQTSAYSMEEILDLMRNDKKNHSGGFIFTLLKNAGEAVTDVMVEEADIRQAFEFYNYVTS